MIIKVRKAEKIRLIKTFFNDRFERCEYDIDGSDIRIIGYNGNQKYLNLSDINVLFNIVLYELLQSPLPTPNN